VTGFASLPVEFLITVFAMSFSIGFVAIIAGTGGGVLFTSCLWDLHQYIRTNKSNRTSFGDCWAIGPTINLIMLAPLKIATTTSAVVISIGDTAAIFPYFMSGSLLPIFAVPAVAGLMTGARFGSAVAVRVKAKYIRYTLTTILLFAGIKLIWVGLWMLEG
jgi:hypothetical protein